MKKSVLFVINTLGCAGAEMAMLELLRQFPREQYELSVYVMLGQGELAARLPQHVVLLNQSFLHTSVLSAEGRRHMMRTVQKCFFHHGGIGRKLAYLCRNGVDMLLKGKVQLDKLLWRVVSDGGDYPVGEYDLAIAFLEGAATYFVADHVKAKKKAAFVHIDYGSAGYTRKLDQNCYDAYDKIFGVSGEVRESFLKFYPEYEEKTEVFHNIIDAGRVKKEAEAEGGFSDDFMGIRLLTVGRLNHQKAYDIALLALKKLKDKGYPVRWYVLGEGEERESLEKQRKALGLEADFVLCGVKENPYPYYRECDIYVHATRFEGKSIAIEEAQILGCAVIASDCNGNREQIVPDEDGILCELSPDEIAGSIIRLIDDENLRRQLGKAAMAKQKNRKNEMHLLLELLGVSYL